MPQRLLRPGLKDSPKWNAVDWKAQSLYVRLLNVVDDYGRYYADPRILLGHCFAMRPDVDLLTIDSICQQLHDNKLAIFYNVDGSRYLQLLKWQERVRAKSKFPEPSADICCQLIASPPSPPPSPPPPSPAVCEQPVELPFRFPKSEKEAVQAASMLCLEEKFIIEVWQKAASRGGTDAKGVEIKSFVHYLQIEKKYDLDRKEREKNGSNSQNHKPTKGPSRTEGTYNANAKSLGHLVK